MELSDEHVAILMHTEKNNLFCGDSQEMQELCKFNLMECAGKKSFVPDPYYKLTDEGRDVLNDMREVGAL